MFIEKSSIGSWNWSSPPWVPQRHVAPCWQQASEEVANHQCKVYQTPWESKSANWVMSDELIGWSYEITRPSVNYAKDWLDHSFLFPGLVWSEKEFHFECDHEGAVNNHFLAHWAIFGMVTNEQSGDPSASLLLTSVKRQFHLGWSF